MRLARHAAQNSNFEYIGDEHILLGISKASGSVGSNALRNLDISPDKLENAYNELCPAASSKVTIGEIPFTLLAKKVLEHSLNEAANLEHNYVGTEHLLLSLTVVDSTNVVALLEKVGTTQEEVREEVLELLGAAPDKDEYATMMGKSALMINSVLRDLIRKDAIKLENLDAVKKALLDYAFAATIDSDIRKEVHYLSNIK